MAREAQRARAGSLAAAVCALLVSSSAALAVDLPPAPNLPPAPDLPAADGPTDEFSGWYLRGDVGAGFAAAPALRGSAETLAAQGIVSPFSASAFRNETLSTSTAVGAGLGYVFNPWFRADATLEYRFGARFGATYAVLDPASGLAVDRVSGTLSSLVALVNGYVDLGDWWGATPFVGAGIGVADNALSGVSDAGWLVSGAGAAPIGGLFSNASKTNFAWALMAGLDFDIAPNVKLELSYRYLNLGEAAFGGAHCAAAACGSRVASSRALASNDVRVGLVWFVDAPVVARY